MENKNTKMEVNLNSIRPYGEMLDDGMMQISFTLPLSCNEKTKNAGKQLAIKMGIENPDVVHINDIGENFTFMIIYGKLLHSVDYTLLENFREDIEIWSKEQVETFASEKIKREIVVVGATTGTDVHTIGLDSIMNMKGFNGHYGLERYSGFKTYNLGGSLPNRVLLEKAIEVNADAILISQVISHKRLHIHNMTEFVDLLESENMRDRVILMCGGPRLSDELAKELGYDKGFSKGCYPNHVASYIVQELYRRIHDGTVN